MDESRPVGYGIVGCGNIARFHFNGLQAAGARVVHIADVNEKAAEQYVQRTGARFSRDYRKLIADPNVTVVSVLTGARYHAAICTAALAAGKDVICEKTMAGSLPESEAIHAAARASGRLFFAAYMKRFFPAAHAAKELIPRLGRIFSAHVRAWQNWGEDFQTMMDASRFGHILQNYAGAVLKCAGSHMLDMTMFFLGRPSAVLASVDHVPESHFDRRATAGRNGSRSREPGAV
jgi:predicted dehydrogenase